MLLREALDGYFLDAQARHLSPDTIKDYSATFRKLTVALGDSITFESIGVDQIRQFLGSMRVSSKTVLNAYIGLSALWTWAVREHIVGQSIVREIRAPRPDSRAIHPFTEDDIRAMLKASVKTTYVKDGKQVTYVLHNAKRNRAILLFLLDTGVRASELCNIKIGDCDLTNGRVRVMGKGRKERFVDFDAKTAKNVWRYLSTRPERTKNDWLFLTDDGEKMTRGGLMQLIRTMGDRAGVSNAHPHRLRHTYAVMALKNGMDVFTLQNSLGHSSMEMVRRYLNMAQVDMGRIQRRASPVANLGS